MDNPRGQKMLGLLGITLKKYNGISGNENGIWKVMSSFPEKPDDLVIEATITEDAAVKSAEIYRDNNSEDEEIRTNESKVLGRQESLSSQAMPLIENNSLAKVLDNQESLASQPMPAIKNDGFSEQLLEEPPCREIHNNKSDTEQDPFSSDDSIADPNYENNSSASSTSGNEENITLNLPQVRVEKTNELKKLTRKRKRIPSKWKRNKTKRLRNSGQAYNTMNTNKHVEARHLKPPCDDKCTLMCSTKFTEEDRIFLFNKYWNLADIAKQRAFIVTMMHELKRKDANFTTSSGRPKRMNNNVFYLANKEETKIRVCKVFFISTLGITTRCIRSVISKRREGDFEDKRGKHGNQKQIPDAKNDIRAHISSIPQIDSHYTRAHSEKKYIEGGKTITDLYRDYKKLCEQENKPHASLTTYRDIFNHEYNLAFFVPKKDQCMKCVAYENANVEEKMEIENDYLTHQREKNLSREEKKIDKERASENYQVSCFDLQATLPTPKGDVSTFYYKSKLSTYNFTVCDLNKKGQGSVMCFMWHEGQGKRGPNEIGSCLLKYLQRKSENYRGNDLEIVFFSDNCSGQQKNKFVLAAYFYAVQNYNIKSITHKYLVTGHTQNEGDNVHSLIEKNIKRALKSGPIYTPDQYVMLVKTAKKTGEPYIVEELSFDDIFDLKKMTEQTSFGFNKDNSGNIFRFNDACVFKVERESPDKFFYKNSYEESEYKEVGIKSRSSRIGTSDTFQNVKLQCAYKNPLPIPKKKYADLMDLVKANAIKKCHSNFYKNLNVSKD